MMSSANRHERLLQYELLFCIQEPDVDLIDMIERLRTQYPHVDSQLFVGTFALWHRPSPRRHHHFLLHRNVEVILRWNVSERQHRRDQKSKNCQHATGVRHESIPVVSRLGQWSDDARRDPVRDGSVHGRQRRARSSDAVHCRQERILRLTRKGSSASLIRRVFIARRN